MTTTQIKKFFFSVLAAFILSVEYAHAASIASNPVTVLATVDGPVSISFVMNENTTDGVTLSSINFGDLADEGGGSVLHSTRNVVMRITANTHGAPYTIKQTGSSLTAGSATIPTGSCVVKPLYIAADNNGDSQPSGSQLGAAGSWVAVDKVLYTSETGTAAMRTIQCVYSITSDPNNGATETVPADQPAGNYTSSITFTVTS